MKKQMAVFAVSFLIVFALLNCMKVNTSGYELSTEPHISNFAKQKMIIAEAKGKPEEISGKCIGSLYRVYFKLKFKGKMMEPPRGRWPVSLNTPQGQWTAAFALPIPEEITALPEMKNLPVEVKMGYWEYGQTAEVLHKGPYEKEVVTIETLKKFITENGYKITGTHEEIYIKGPGMFGKGNTENYKTLIRYPVKKIEAAVKKNK